MSEFYVTFLQYFNRNNKTLITVIHVASYPDTDTASESARTCVNPTALDSQKLSSSTQPTV